MSEFRVIADFAAGGGLHGAGQVERDENPLKTLVKEVFPSRKTHNSDSGGAVHRFV